MREPARAGTPGGRGWRARPSPVTPETGEPVLMFQLAGRYFAVDLTRVEQVLDYRRPTRTPQRPPHVEGVIEHRGRFFALTALRKRLGIPDPGPERPPIVLLTGIGPDPVQGLLVDQVLRVLTLARETVLAPPPRVFGIRAEFIRGVANAGGHPLVWLDAAKLLTSAEPVTLLA
jgi:purine-binding chemotaxis protein CheW